MDANCCAVVVNYRCVDDTLTLLRSLDEYAPGLPVVLVDNGSGDGSADALRREIAGREEIDLLALEDNDGFGAGSNRGFERALALHPGIAHVLLLNPDTRVTAGAVDALIRCAQSHPSAGIVGGRILDLAGERVLYEHGRHRRFTLGRSHARAPRGRDEYETGFITGALMLLDAQLLRAGLRFDESYFLYVEDMDLCRRVVSRGRTLWVTRQAVVHHREGGSQTGEEATAAALRPSQLRYITRNKVLFARRWLRPWQRAVFYVVAFIAKPIAGVLRYRSLGFLATYYGALFEGLRFSVPEHGAEHGDR